MTQQILPLAGGTAATTARNSTTSALLLVSAAAQDSAATGLDEQQLAQLGYHQTLHRCEKCGSISRRDARHASGAAVAAAAHPTACIRCRAWSGFSSMCLVLSSMSVLTSICGECVQRISTACVCAIATHATSRP